MHHLRLPCHRPGRLACASLLAATALALAGADDDNDRTSLDTAKKVIERYIEAIGGEDALRSHTSRTQTGTVTIEALDIEGDVTIHAAAPSYFLMESDLGEHGVNRTGFDGEIGWNIDKPTGATLLEKARYEQLRRNADFYAPLNMTRHYEHIELRGQTRFNQSPCYELKMTDRSDRDVFAYFDVETGLYVGLKGEFEGHLGPVPAVTVFSEYETFDGVKLPTQLDTTFKDILQRITIRKVSHEPLEMEIFELPEQIAALLDDAPDEDVVDGEDEGDGEGADADDEYSSRPNRVLHASP